MADVDPRLLAAFVALAEELHFGRTAVRRHLTQPALSQQIRRLEHQLGVELFERNTRRVRLTAAGQAFLTGARESLEVLDDAVRQARRAGAARTLLRVGVDINVPDGVVKTLRLFGAARPDVELRPSIQQQDDVLHELLAGRVDLAVGWTAPPRGTDAIRFAPLAPVEIHGVLRADDPLAARHGLPRRELVRHRLVMYSPSRETRPFYDFFLGCFAGADGRLPRVEHVTVVDDAQAAMLDTVERVGGFTLCVAADFARLGRQTLVARPFDPPVQATLVIMWRRPHPPALLDALRSFVDGQR